MKRNAILEYMPGFRASSEAPRSPLGDIFHLKRSSAPLSAVQGPNASVSEAPQARVRHHAPRAPENPVKENLSEGCQGRVATCGGQAGAWV
jgi:hypothetical protein